MNVFKVIQTSKGPVKIVEYEKKLLTAVIEMYRQFDDRVLDYALPPYTPDKIRRYLFTHDEDWFNYLAVSSDQIVGHLQVHRFTDVRRSHVCEFFIYIHQDYHDLGIGKTMIMQMIERARKKKVKKIKLACFADNERAINVYKKMGFQIEARLEKEFFRKGEYLDKLYMSFWLD
ncbi:MAG: GNAT family N-acetyltransferase [Candidatus Odinarchaeota archaeon]